MVRFHIFGLHSSVERKCVPFSLILGLYVSYLDIEAKIIRPDMECTNGYVHVIDKVIMKRRDIVLSGAEKNVSALSMTFLAAFFARFLNR